MIFASAWKQGTGITAEEAAARAEEMYRLYLNSGNDGECGDMACCGDQVIIKRFNPDTGRPEVSKDGGVTWTPAPDDTQNAIPLYPPIVGDGTDRTKCDAATNASEHINELIDATHNNLETASTVFELAAAIAEAALALFVVIVSGGTLSPLVATLMAAIWAGATGALALGVEAYDAYWVTDKKDAILCMLYCTVGENGQWNEAQYQAFRSKMKSTLPASPAFDIIMTTINAGGATGVSQMGSYGAAADADCASCEPCEEQCSDFDITAIAIPEYFLTPRGGCTWRLTMRNEGAKNRALLCFMNKAETTDIKATITFTKISGDDATSVFYMTADCNSGYSLIGQSTFGVVFESDPSTEPAVYDVHVISVP